MMFSPAICTVPVTLQIEAAVQAVPGLWDIQAERNSPTAWESMDAVGRMLAAMSRASGRVPQISMVVGPAAGAAAYDPAFSDVVIMAPGARVFIAGPDVIKSVTREQIDMAGLGGPEAHSRRSDVAHITADSKGDAYLRARRMTTYFTRPGRIEPGLLGDGVDLRVLLPESPRRAYCVRLLVRAILNVEGDGGGSRAIPFARAAALTG
jgi:acetyl-CoA/propionyl-CoA carboxylase carboxyl transferase subunit